MSFIKGLRCRECGREYPAKLQAGCEDCFAPLEVDYHYDAIAKVLTRETSPTGRIPSGDIVNCFPSKPTPWLGWQPAGTPLVRADRLGRKYLESITFI